MYEGKGRSRVVRRLSIVKVIRVRESSGFGGSCYSGRERSDFVYKIFRRKSDKIK